MSKRGSGTSGLLDMANLVAVLTTSRLGSISAAAAELQVTQSVITRRIQKIESAVGVRLFERHSRGVRLTPAGQEITNSINRAISDIVATADRVRNEHEDSSIPTQRNSRNIGVL